MLFARRWLAAEVEQAADRPAGRACATGSRSIGSPAASGGCGSGDGSPLAGRTLEELRLRDTIGRAPAGDRARGPVRAGDRPAGRDHAAAQRRRPARSTCSSPTTDAEELARELGLELLPLSGAYFADRAQEVGMVEVMLPEGSSVVGRTLVRSEFRTRYDVTAVGLRRGNQARSDDITERGAAGRRHPAGGRLLVRHPQAADLPPRHDRARPAGRARRGAARGQPGTAGAALPAAGRRPDGQRHRAQRAGGADRLPAHGRAAAASTSPAPTARSIGPA